MEEYDKSTVIYPWSSLQKQLLNKQAQSVERRADACARIVEVGVSFMLLVWWISTLDTSRHAHRNSTSSISIVASCAAFYQFVSSLVLGEGMERRERADYLMARWIPVLCIPLFLLWKPMADIGNWLMRLG